MNWVEIAVCVAFCLPICACVCSLLDHRRAKRMHDEIFSLLNPTVRAHFDPESKRWHKDKIK